MRFDNELIKNYPSLFIDAKMADEGYYKSGSKFIRFDDDYPIYCPERGKCYASIKDASKDTGYPYEAVSEAVHNRTLGRGAYRRSDGQWDSTDFFFNIKYNKKGLVSYLITAKLSQEDIKSLKEAL